RDLAAAWSRNPWIRDVKSVRVTGEPAVRLEVDYRVPAAFVFVESLQGLYPVDRDGVLLPPTDFGLSDTSRLPHVKNVSTVPVGPAGTFWGDPVVLAAARLAEVLAPEQNLDRYWN